MDGPYSEDIRQREETTSVNHGKRDGQTEVLSDDDRLSCSGFTDFMQTNESARHTQPGSPDSQWQAQRGRWLVLIACCLSSFVTMGMAFSLGTVYLDIMDTFDTSRPLAALAQSLAIGIGFGAGIVTGPLLGRLGGAITLMHGGLTCCVGCVGGSLAPNIYLLIACFGGLTGLGVSSCYLAAQIVMGTTFQKRRNVALSMITMSTGAGTAIYPSLVRWMVDKYTLRGMFLILGGICSNCVLFGMIVKTFGTNTDPVLSFEMEESIEEEKEDTATRPVNGKYHGSPNTENSEMMDDKKNMSRTFVDQNLRVNEGSSLQRKSSEKLSVENTIQRIASKNAEINSEGRSKTEYINRTITASAEATDRTGSKTSKRNETDIVVTDETGGWKTRMDETNQTTNQRLKNSRTSVVTISEDVEVLGSVNTELPSAKLNLKQGQRRTSGQRRRSSVSETFQIDLFHNTRYLIVTLFCNPCFLTFNAPILFITDIGKGAGLSLEQGAQLVSILAISSTIARGATGLLQTLCHISALNLYGIVLGCSGVTVFGYAILDYIDYGDMFAGHVCVSVIFAIFMGSVHTSTSLCCLELVGVHQYAAALGYQFFIVGICSSIGGPLGGWIKDTTGSYSSVFCMAITQGLLAAITVFTISYCARKSPAKRRNHNASNTNNDIVNEKTYSYFNNGYSHDSVGVGSTEPETVSTHF